MPVPCEPTLVTSGGPKRREKASWTVVGHLLAAKDQNRMFLESRARRRVCGIVRRDLRKRHTAQLGGEAWTQRDDFHRRGLRSFIVCSTFP